MRRKHAILLSFLLVFMLVSACGAGLWLLKNRGFRAYQIAEEAYARQDWPEAKQQYGWYLARQPDDAVTLSRYAEVCQKLLSNRADTLRSASQAYFRIAVLQEDNIEAATRAARFCEDRQFWDELQYYAGYFLRRYGYSAEDPSTLDQRAAPFLYWLALAEERQGSLESARLKYEKLAAKPEVCPLSVYGALAGVMRQQGMPDSGVAILDSALAQHPNAPEVYVARAEFFLEKLRLDDAQRELRQALELAPDSPEVQQIAAELHLAREEWDEAGAYAAAAMQQSPRIDTVLLISKVNHAKGRIEETAKLLEDADSLFIADNPTLYVLLADLQIELERYDKLEETLEQYRAAWPDHGAMFDYLEARKQIRKADPSQEGFFEEVDSVLQKLRVVTQRAPDFTPARLQLVLVYLKAASNPDLEDEQKNDLYSMAKSMLVAYIEANPSDAQAQELWKEYFSEPTVERAGDDARKAMADPEAKPDELTRRSERLLAAVKRQGLDAIASRASLELARDGLERAFAQNPTTLQTFEALVEVCLELGDTEDLAKARDAIAIAEDKGLDQHALRVAHASLQLKESTDADVVERAVDSMLADCGDGDVSAIELADWATVLHRHDQGERYRQELEQCLSAEKDESRRLLFCNELVRAARMSGDYVQALEQSKALRAAVQSDPSAQETLIEQTCATVEAMIAAEDPAGRQDALEALDWVLANKPGDIDARMLKARLFLRSNDVAAAETVLQDLRKEAPQNVDVLVLSAEVARQQGAAQQQYDFVQRASSISPSDVRVQLLLAQAHMDSGRYTEALGILEGLRAGQPQDGRVLSMLSRSYAGAGRIHDAENLAGLLESMATDAAAIQRPLASLRAWIAFCREDWQTAEQLAAAHWRAEPADVSLLRLLVTALSRQGRQSEAEQVLAGAAEELKDPEVYTELARWHLQKGGSEDLNKAAALFTRAQVTMPGYFPAILGMIEVETRQNSMGTALGLCNRLLAAAPENVDVLHRKAVLLARSNQLAEAVETCNEALSIAERPEVLFLRASLRLSLGELEQSIQDAERYVELNGTSTAAAHALLADALLRLPQPDRSKAATHYRAAVEKRDAGEPVDAKRLEWVASQLAGDDV